MNHASNGNHNAQEEGANANKESQNGGITLITMVHGVLHHVEAVADISLSLNVQHEGEAKT